MMKKKLNLRRREKREKKGSKKGNKKAKKVIEEQEEEEQVEEEEQPMMTDETTEENNVEKITPPQYTKQDDETVDFISDITKGAKLISYQPDLITGGMNAGTNPFDWLVPATNTTNNNSEHHLTQELALFDTPLDIPVNSTQKGVEKQSTEDMMVFYANDGDDKEDDEIPEPVMNKKEIDPWDLAREISVLDDLNMTGQERKWKQEKEQKLMNQKQAPKLKDLVKAANNKNQLDNDAFKSAIASQVDNSMAIVPAANWNQPLYAPAAPYDYSMSIVPYGSFPVQGQQPQMAHAAAAHMMYGYYPPQQQQQQQQPQQQYYYPQQFSWN